jgi:hypothetical protein
MTRRLFGAFGRVLEAGETVYVVRVFLFDHFLITHLRLPLRTSPITLFAGIGSGGPSPHARESISKMDRPDIARAALWG